MSGNKGTILIIDDEADIRGMIRGILEDEGYATLQADGSPQTYRVLAENTPDMIVLDIWLKNSAHDGLEILKTVKADSPHIPVVMISGHGTIETAVSAIKQGAYDFIEKPFKSDRLLLMIERALETAQLKRENESLRRRADGPSDLMGNSPAIAAVRQMLERVAPTNSRILLSGEAGTGKDIAARTIHKLSKRANGPFLSVNCAILRPDRLEIELFGEGTSPGVLERADKGTLLLDEVADMPPETQGKIVRVLQEQRFQRVGGHETVEADLRIVASTNRDLGKLMQEGRFRQDLYYRLNVVPIELPPLRARVQDIPDLAAYFAGLYSAQSGMPAGVFSDAALAVMQAYGWPGNVRQLRNVIEWTMIMAGAAPGQEIRADQLPPEIMALDAGGPAPERDPMTLPLREARELFERDYLLSQVKRFGGNVSKTAQFVGMERSALHRKLKQLGVSGEDDAAGENRKIA